MTWWEPFYVFSNEIAHLRMSKQRFENAISASQICLKCDSSPIASYCTSLEIPPFLYFVSCFFSNWSYDNDDLICVFYFSLEWDGNYKYMFVNHGFFCFLKISSDFFQEYHTNKFHTNSTVRPAICVTLYIQIHWFVSNAKISKALERRRSKKSKYKRKNIDWKQK